MKVLICEDDEIMRNQIIDKLVHCGGMKVGEINVVVAGKGRSKLVDELIKIDGVDFNRSQQIISNFENSINYINPRYMEPIPNDSMINRDYGWYNKFNKVNKRKNYK